MSDYQPAHNPLKQALADGITDWLRDQAPVAVKMAMTKSDVLILLQSICDKIEPEHLQKTPTE